MCFLFKGVKLMMFNRLIFCMLIPESEKSQYSVIDKMPGADSMRFFPMSRVLALPPGKTDRQTNTDRQRKRDRHRTERKTQIAHSQMQGICKQPSLIKGPFTSVSTLRQLCNDATGLIENNGAARKWVASLFWSDSIVFKENSIPSVIAALTLMLGVNRP